MDRSRRGGNVVGIIIYEHGRLGYIFIGVSQSQPDEKS